MAMNSRPQFGCFLLSLLTFCVCISADPPTPPSVYDILPKFALPSGLLPDSVVSYTLGEDGTFEVQLAKPCYVQFDYLVYYEKKISGKLSVGSITNLKGIQVKRFLFWFDVDEIKVDLPPTDSIYFTVGIINKQLDISQFKTVHSCTDKATSCRDSLRNAFELPASADDDIPMLLTE